MVLVRRGGFCGARVNFSGICDGVSRVGRLAVRAVSRLADSHTGCLAQLAILLAAKLPCSVKGSCEDVFSGGCETDVGCAVASPTAGDGEEEVGLVGDEGLLQVGREHEVAVAELDGGERGEDVASDAEVGGSHVGTLFRAG